MVFFPISGQLRAGSPRRGTMVAPLLRSVPEHGQEDKASEAPRCPARAILICGPDHDISICRNQQKTYKSLDRGCGAETLQRTSLPSSFAANCGEAVQRPN